MNHGRVLLRKNVNTDSCIKLLSIRMRGKWRLECGLTETYDVIEFCMPKPTRYSLLGDGRNHKQGGFALEPHSRANSVVGGVPWHIRVANVLP